MRLLDRLELGGVEILVQVIATVVGETVESARDPLDEAVTAEDGEPVTGVVAHGNPEVVDGTRSEVPLVPHQLQDLIVDRLHPVRALSHTRGSSADPHISSGVGVATLYTGLTIPVSIVESPY